MQYRITWLTGLINIVFGVAETLIGLRFLVKLFGGNPQAPFVQWLYETTQPLLAPFAGMFPAPILEGGLILEFTALFALLVYELVRYLVTYFLMWMDAGMTEASKKKK